MSSRAPSTEVDDLLTRAEAALGAGDEELATGLCTQALRADQTRPEAATLLSRICFARGREDAALLAVEEVQSAWLSNYLHHLPSGDARLACYGALIAEARDLLPLGRHLAIRATTLDPKSINAHILLARIERRLGDLEQSFKALERLGTLSTKHTAVRREVARWLAASGKLEYALEHYESLLRFHPGDTLSRLERWKIRAELGLNAEYRSEFGQDEYIHTTFFYSKRGGTFLDLDPGDGVLHNNTHYFEEQLAWQGLCVGRDAQHTKVVSQNRKCPVLACSVGLLGPARDDTAVSEASIAHGDRESARAAWAEMLASTRIGDVDYCSVSANGELVVASLPLQRLNIAVLSIPQVSERLAHFLRQAGYTHDLTVGDEVWYRPQLVRKGSLGRRVSTRA